MGSITLPMPHDRKAFLDDEMSSARYEVIKSAMIGSTYYAAVKNVETTLTLAAVIKTQSSGDGMFTFKVMDETVNPYFYECPKGIFDLLTPLDDMDKQKSQMNLCDRSIQNCAAWRDTCKQVMTDKARRRKLKPGVKIKLPRELTFEGGGVHDTFVKVRGSLYHPVGASYNVHLKGHHLDGFEIIS